MEPAKAAIDSTRIPITVGVTGHKDLVETDVPALEAAFDRLLQDYRRRYPNSPVEIYTGLAEGADQLAARVALRRGARVVAVLPMPQDSYEIEFDSEAARERFRDLLSKVDRVITLPLLPDTVPDDLTEFTDKRIGQYELLGSWIVLHCQVLVAFWDGERGTGAGGTGAVVDYQLKEVPARFRRGIAFDQRDVGPVIHISTPRGTKGSSIVEAGKTAVLVPEGHSVEQMDAAIANTFKAIEKFNRDSSRHGASAPGYPLVEDEAWSGAEALPKGLADLGRLFTRADGLAGFFQRKTRRSLKAMLGLAMLAVVMFEIYSADILAIHGVNAPLPGTDKRLSTVLVYIFFSSFFLAFGIFFYARWRGFQDRYHDYRSLAEALRVQFFWDLCGITANAGDHYQKKRENAMDWAVTALRSAEIHSFDAQFATNAGTESRLRLALERWVEDQHRYFTRTVSRQQQTQKRLGFSSLALVVVGVLAVALFFIESEGWIPAPRWLIAWTSAIAPMALAGSASIGGYLGIAGYAEHINRYAVMARLYAVTGSACRAILGRGDLDEARDQLRRLGIEAVQENSEWLLLHRSRPIDRPTV